jgi:hypothetical protein
VICTHTPSWVAPGCHLLQAPCSIDKGHTRAIVDRNKKYVLLIALKSFLLVVVLVFALGRTGGRAGARCRPGPPRSGIGPWRPEAEGRDRKEGRPDPEL